LLTRRGAPSADPGAAIASRASGASFCNSSTACRNETFCQRITQSITDPPAWHAPKQCHRFDFGLITNDGVRSSWNGHRPTRSCAPCFANPIPAASTSRTRLT